MNNPALDTILKPRSVAVVGASATPGKIGYSVVNNLLKDGYQGKIYPINPPASEILGLKVYPSVLDVHEEIECAVITVPAKLVAGGVDECGKNWSKGLSVITSGFGEVGRHDLEDELVETGKKYGCRILGPNIVGVLSNSYGMNASFAPFPPWMEKHG
jgi:acetyltransferase